MFKFLLVLLIFGQATCYHSYGHGYPQDSPSSTQNQMTHNQQLNPFDFQIPYQWRDLFKWPGISQSSEHSQSQSYEPSHSDPNEPSQSTYKSNDSDFNESSEDDSYETTQSSNKSNERNPDESHEDYSNESSQSNFNETNQSSSKSNDSNSNESGENDSYETSESSFNTTERNPNESYKDYSYESGQSNYNETSQSSSKSNDSNSNESGEDDSYEPSQTNSNGTSQSGYKSNESNFKESGNGSDSIITNHTISSGSNQTNVDNQIKKGDQIDKPPSNSEAVSDGLNATFNLNATDLSGNVNSTDESSEINGNAQNNQTLSPDPEDKPMLMKKDTVETTQRNLPATAIPATMSVPVPALGEFQAPSFEWHVGIYTKTTTPFTQICGGSLVKVDVVLSAAHCFWKDDELERAALFAVATAKLQRSWDNSADPYEQHSDIRELKIPPRFLGAQASFQDDLAIAWLTTPLELAPGTKPICVDFDPALEKEQFERYGYNTEPRVAGWGLTEINGPPAERLGFVKLPYVSIESCIRYAQPGFLKYITSDKICAGDQKSGRAVCRGDSGGGLVFYSNRIPYLRGIASTAPRDDNKCNAFAIATFTYLKAHMAFLIEHVPDISEGCLALDNGQRKITTDNLETLPVTSDKLATPDINESMLPLTNSNVPSMAEQVDEQNQETEGSTAPSPNDETMSESGLFTNLDKGETEQRISNLMTMNYGIAAVGNHTFQCNCFCK